MQVKGEISRPHISPLNKLYTQAPQPLQIDTGIPFVEWDFQLVHLQRLSIKKKIELTSKFYGFLTRSRFDLVENHL